MSDLMVALKKGLNIDKMIVKRLHRKSDKDVDIIISKEEFDKIIFAKNFYLLKNRVKCDKHIFYLFYYKKKVYVIDFNIDGLFINGRIFYDLENISLFIKKTRFAGIFCLKRNKEI